MRKQQGNTEESKDGAAGVVRSDWRALMKKFSYHAIVRNVHYIAFVVLLCVLYINNTHRAMETQRALTKRNAELKELRWKYMDVKSQLMNAQIETKVIEEAAGIGLKPLTLPAYSVVTDSIAKN